MKKCGESHAVMQSCVRIARVSVGVDYKILHNPIQQHHNPAFLVMTISGLAPDQVGAARFPRLFQRTWKM